MARISSRNITQAPGTPRVPLRDRQQTPEPDVPQTPETPRVPLRDKQQTSEPDVPHTPESGEPGAPQQRDKQQTPEPGVPQVPESGESSAPQQSENLVFVQKVPNSRNNMYRLCEKRNGKVVHISSLGYTSQIQYKQKVAEAYAERLNKLRGH